MKKLVAACVIYIVSALFLNQVVEAHSHIASSYPSEGQVITQPLKEISLKFEGAIMPGSFFELVNENNEKMKVDTISILDQQLLGTITSPLAKGSYSINWSIISSDGHVLEGEIPFSTDYEEVVDEPGTLQVEEKVEVKELETEQQGVSFAFIIIGLAIIVFICTMVITKNRKK